MKKLLFTLKNIFKLSNLGTIIFFILNMVVLFGIFSMFSEGEPVNIWALLGIYALSLLLAFSRPGQKVMCFFNGARKMVRHDMRDRVMPVVEEVYRAAKKKTPQLPDRIYVRIMHESEPNAFAIGTNTICVTEGMLSMPENLMAGVIAHEMGHLAMQHTVIQLLIGGGNLIITGIILLASALQAMLSAGTVASGAAAGTSRSSTGCLIGSICALFCAMLTGIIWLWTQICSLLLMGSSRANEYAADRYAHEIGYGDELAEALDRLTLGAPRSTILQLLYNSHPEPSDRIGRLHGMGSTYSRF